MVATLEFELNPKLQGGSKKLASAQFRLQLVWWRLLIGRKLMTASTGRGKVLFGIKGE